MTDEIKALVAWTDAEARMHTPGSYHTIHLTKAAQAITDLSAENELLRHDIDRQINIANSSVNERDEARAGVAKLTARLDEAVGVIANIAAIGDKPALLPGGMVNPSEWARWLAEGNHGEMEIQPSISAFLAKHGSAE